MPFMSKFRVAIMWKGSDLARGGIRWSFNRWRFMTRTVCPRLLNDVGKYSAMKDTYQILKVN